MERVLEPEVMDDPAQALAYARASFEEVNRAFVDRFVELVDHRPIRNVVDLGCGPADIPLRMARALPEARIAAVDASAPMLVLGREGLHDAAMGRRVSLVRAAVPHLPFPDGAFDAVVSNSLLHHLAVPDPFWTELRRLGARGAFVLVVDLLRPDSPSRAREIVDREAGGEDAILQRDFFHSLCAAFTIDEVRRQLAVERLDLQCRVASDRHWMVRGRLPERRTR